MVTMSRQSSTGSNRSSYGDYNNNYSGGYSVYENRKPAPVTGFQRNVSSGSTYSNHSNSHSHSHSHSRNRSKNNIYRSNSKNKKTSIGSILTLLQYAIFLVLSIYYIRARMSLNQTTKELKKWNSQYIDLYQTYAKTEDELNQVHEDFTTLNLDLHAIMSDEIVNEVEVEVHNRESRQRVAKTFIGRIEAQIERINSLKLFIQNKDKMELEKK